MEKDKVFINYDDFLRICLPNYYEELRFKEITDPREAGRKAAEEVMRKVNIRELDALK